MDRITMQGLLNELDDNSIQTLVDKNARYASDNDCLHNFNAGSEIAGVTPAQACWGYLTKHLVALRDMVMKNEFHNREDFLEKCQDSINYIRFIWCLGNEEMQNYVSDNRSCETSIKYVSDNKTYEDAINDVLNILEKENE